MSRKSKPAPRKLARRTPAHRTRRSNRAASTSTNVARILNERDAATYIAFSQAWLRTKRREGGGPPFIRIDRAVRYNVAALDAFLSSHTVRRA